MAAKPVTYKVKKGDTLSGIAKKYKHKNWKTIWDHPANKRVKSQRKKPEAIEPGDVFTIPPNEAEKKKQQSEQDQMAAAVVQEQLLGVQLAARGATIGAAAKAAADALKKSEKHIKTTGDEIQQLLKNLDLMQRGDTGSKNPVRIAHSLVIGQLGIALTTFKAAKGEAAKQGKAAAKLGSGVATTELSSDSKKAVDSLLGKKCPEITDIVTALEKVIGAFEGVMKSKHWKTALLYLESTSADASEPVRQIERVFEEAKRGTLGHLAAKISIATAKAGICKQQASKAQSRSNDQAKSLARAEKAAA